MFLLLLVAGLVGCSAPESADDLVDRYLVRYPDGSEELTLSAGGALLRVVRINGLSPVTSEGKRHHQEDGYLILEDGYLLAHDPAGKLIQSAEDRRAGRASLSVTEIPFGSVHLMQSDYYSYTKQD